MHYEQFKSIVLSQLKEHFPVSMYEINIRKVTKNNGLQLDGLCIFQMGEDVSPTIYLNGYYDKYVRGTILADIIKEIIREYEDGMIQKPSFECNPSYLHLHRVQEAFSPKRIDCIRKRE